jgi:hypothetical protein
LAFAAGRPWLLGRPRAPVYLVMTFVVAPLSKVSLPQNLPIWLVSFSIHLIGFSLLIALGVRRVMGSPGEIRSTLRQRRLAVDEGPATSFW